jgi:DNA-binding LacI/PurR family transcriptional regulator
MSIVQVAKYAGVSAATVSRVLNSVPVVSESTVKNVRAAMEALKYDPMAIKRGPRPGGKRPRLTSTGMIAIMTVGNYREKLRFPVTNMVVQAISRSAKQSGVRVLLDEMPELSDISPIIANHEVDGAVVFMSDEAPSEVLERLHAIVPIVWAMGGQAGPLPVDHVSENNIAVGYLAHQYLQQRGFDNMAFLSLVPHKRNALQRGQAFAGAAAEARHHCRALVLSDDPFVTGLYGANVTTKTHLAELIEAFANMPNRPGALFIDRDSTTARVYPLLLRQGIQPGRDVTIVSCDNEESALASLDPRPATIDLGAEEIGIRVIRRLVLRIENRTEPPVFIQATPRLIPGEDFISKVSGQTTHGQKMHANITNGQTLSGQIVSPSGF